MLQNNSIQNIIRYKGVTGVTIHPLSEREKKLYYKKYHISGYTASQ